MLRAGWSRPAARRGTPRARWCPSCPALAISFKAPCRPPAVRIVAFANLVQLHEPFPQPVHLIAIDCFPISPASSQKVTQAVAQSLSQLDASTMFWRIWALEPGARRRASYSAAGFADATVAVLWEDVGSRKMGEMSGAEVFEGSSNVMTNNPLAQHMNVVKMPISRAMQSWKEGKQWPAISVVRHLSGRGAVFKTWKPSKQVRVIFRIHDSKPLPGPMTWAVKG